MLLKIFLFPLPGRFDRDYFRRYMDSGKKIILIGANFDNAAGQIDHWVFEQA